MSHQANTKQTLSSSFWSFFMSFFESLSYVLLSHLFCHPPLPSTAFLSFTPLKSYSTKRICSSQLNFCLLIQSGEFGEFWTQQQLLTRCLLCVPESQNHLVYKCLCVMTWSIEPLQCCRLLEICGWVCSSKREKHATMSCWRKNEVKSAAKSQTDRVNRTRRDNQSDSTWNIAIRHQKAHIFYPLHTTKENTQGQFWLFLQKCRFILHQECILLLPGFESVAKD